MLFVPPKTTVEPNPRAVLAKKKQPNTTTICRKKQKKPATETTDTKIK